MGSADQQFSLAEILSQTYGVQEECEEAVRRPEQREEGLVKDFVSQVPCMGPRVLWLLASAATSPASRRCWALRSQDGTGQAGSCLQGLCAVDPAVLSVWRRSPLCSRKWPRLLSS